MQTFRQVGDRRTWIDRDGDKVNLYSRGSGGDAFNVTASNADRQVTVYLSREHGQELAETILATLQRESS